MEVLPAKLGIVAGGGALPQKLLQFCDEKKIETFVIAFDGQTDLSILQGRPHDVTRLGAAGQIIKTLKGKGYNDLVLIGSIKRPHLKELRPDLYTATFFAKLGLKFLGDDGLLKAIRAVLEAEGFCLHAIQDIMRNLLMPDGILSRAKPDKAQTADMREGLRIAKAIGALDIGQAVVIQDGLILGVEGAEGTDELIRRCADYRRTNNGGILVKSCKPDQDRTLDMPTIGSDTVILCAALGYHGVAVEAGAALLVDIDETLRAADEAGMFLAGIAA